MNHVALSVLIGRRKLTRVHRRKPLRSKSPAIDAPDQLFRLVVCSLDRSVAADRKLAVGAVSRGPLPAKIHASDGRPGRFSPGSRHSVHFIRPAVASSLPQVKFNSVEKN